MSVDELPAFLRDEEDLDALGAKIGDIDDKAMRAIPYKLRYPRGERNLEQIEQLEQLRFLKNGYKIKVMISDYNSISVDTPQDLARVRKIVKQQTTDDR